MVQLLIPTDSKSETNLMGITNIIPSNLFYTDMRNLKIDSTVARRLAAFLESDLYTIQSEVAKSEYWEDQSSKIRNFIVGERISITGESGFYLPPSSSLAKRILHKIRRTIASPAYALKIIKARLLSKISTPRLMTHSMAFDAVMTHDPISDPDLSPFRVNHIELSKKPGICKTYKDIKADYESWSGYKASENIVDHYYSLNLLAGYIELNNCKTVLEIGAGNGNLSSILYQRFHPEKVIIVDLPETLTISIPFIASLFPKATLKLPHEIGINGLTGAFDFGFITVDQLSEISDNSIDLAINCFSFQEMKPEQIDLYFELIQRTVKNDGHFFVTNRAEKIPCGAQAYTKLQNEPPIRFAEYPWKDRNEVLIYETSRLSRLVQFDNVFIRLEKINK